MTETIHFYVEFHTHKARWWWLCVWQGPFYETQLNFTYFWKSFDSDRSWQLSLTSSCCCILSFPHWHKSKRWPSTVSSSWPQCGQEQPCHSHLSASEGSAVNSRFFILWQWHLSVWSLGPMQSHRVVYGSAVLWCLWTHQSLGFEGCVKERNRNRETERGAESFKVHFSSAVPLGEENDRANDNRS